MRDNAPEWYAARKVELSGQGYPKISDVPADRDTRPSVSRLNLSNEEVNAALVKFYASGRTDGPTETPEQMRAWAADQRRAVEGQLPAPDFLTDEDVAALKAIFDRPRGRL